MTGLKEHVIYSDLFERTDFPPQAQQAVPKRQFIRPLPYSELITPTQQRSSESSQAQLSMKQQFMSPFPSAALPVPAVVPSPFLTSGASSTLPEQLSTTPPTSLPQVRPKKQKKPKTKMTRGKRVRRWFVICSILTVIAVIFFSQGNGAVGAWAADTMRAVLGPTITAQVESWYLGLSDSTHQLQYNLGGSHVDAPWTVSTPPSLPTVTIPPSVVWLAPMPLNRMSPLVTPALNGEGVWLTQEMAAAPYNYLPLDAKAFIRPDPSHPYAIVTLLQFDTRFFRLHIVAGTTEPGGPRGFYGPGVIPALDQKGNALLAAFNGGFKYAAGAFLTAQTLGIALHAAGAVMAMQTDINPFWVRAFLYSRDAHGTLNIIKLNPAMYGTGTEYLSSTERDFFYLTRFTPPPPSVQPPKATPQSHETVAQ